MSAARDFQFERIAFFSDAVFAIAITLLVIEIKLPHPETLTAESLGPALLELVPNYIGFLISFFVIGRFWSGHHRIMGLMRDWDAGFLRLNLLFLMAIAFMPFPTAVVSEFAGTATGIVFYAGWLMVAGLANLGLVLYVQRRPQLLAEPITPAQRHDLRSSWIPLVLSALAMAAVQLQLAAALAVLVIGPSLLWLGLALLGRKQRTNSERLPPAAS